MTTIRNAFATAVLTAAVGLTGLTLYDAGQGEKGQLRKDYAAVATLGGLGLALAKREEKKRIADQAPVPGKEYQQMTIGFTADSSWTRFVEKLPPPLPFMLDDPLGVSYYMEVSLLVPTEIVPDLERWMAQNLQPKKTGNEKMIEFLKDKGAILHNESGPAYRVNKWHSETLLDCGSEVVREEYWVKGVRVAAPIPPISSAKGIELFGKVRL